MSKAKPKGRTRASKKLPWGDMAITRVNLNPEQAVLSCYEQPTPGARPMVSQCNQPDFGCEGTYAAISR